MTTDQTTTPPRGYPPVSELRRSRSDRKILGVAGGLGRYAGVDPLVLRVLFVVLAVFGGSGLLLYALGWLLIPDEGERESAGQQMMHGRMGGSGASRVVLTVVAVVIGLLVLGATIDTGPALGGAGVLIVVAVVVVLLARNGPAPQSPVETGPVGTYGPVPPPAPGAYGQTPGTAYAGAAPIEPPASPAWETAPLPPPPPVPRRERSVLGRLTVSATLLVVGLMVGWNVVSDGQAEDFKAVSVIATALAVVGLGLVVGAFVGRSRGLIVLGLLLALVTAASAAADDGFGEGVGDRTWRPATVAGAEREHRLGVGDAVLDLTRLPAGRDADVKVRVGVGQLTVIVPDDARVEVTTHVGAGNLQVLDRPVQDGTDLGDSVTVGDTGGGTLTIDAEIGLGALEVRR